MNPDAENPSMRECDPQSRRRSQTQPAKTPHLHVRSVEGTLMAEAIAITGNVKALLQLRAQIDRALQGEGSHLFEEGVYHEANGTPFEVAVKRASSREEMGEPAPKPERTAEELPWARRATDAAEEDAKSGG